jgi:hypothetical protein
MAASGAATTMSIGHSTNVPVTSHEVTPMRSSPRRLAASLILGVATLVVVGVTPVAAGERSCTGSIGARMLDEVRVPQGARCVLTGRR